MKKILLFLALGLVLFFIGCTSDAHINVDNKSVYVLNVSGDAQGTVDPDKTGNFVFKTGGCLSFSGSPVGTPEVIAKDWGRKCFDGDNSYTFY